MSKRIKPISMIAALAVAFVIAFQTFTIHNMKNAQEEQFLIYTPKRYLRINIVGRVP